MARLPTDPVDLNPATDARWHRVREVFDLAADQPAEQWDAIVRRECADDAPMRDEVLRLLRALREDEFHLDRPALRLGDDDLDDRVGSVVSHYRLVRLIGHGGMGAVYEGIRIDGVVDQRVAVKFIRTIGMARELAARFRRERQILATLEHPNIARLIDGGATALGDPFFIMEYVEGAPITAYCDARTLTVNQRLELFLQVFAAVEHAHGKLIVHRDLKPANMLVAADGRVKLLDFGVAKLLGAQDGDELTTVASGRPFTPEYASPEQLRDEPVSVASDVYALGVVLYELLAGRRPYDLSTRSPLAVLRAVEGETPRPSAVATGDAANYRREADVGRLRARLSGELDNVLRKALRADPSARYKSVEQFGADVQAWLDGRPVLAQPDKIAYRTRKFVHRHRAGVTAAAVACVAIVVAVAAWVAQQRRSAREASWQVAVSAASDLDEVGSARLAQGDIPGAIAVLDHANRICTSEPARATRSVDCLHVWHDLGVAWLWSGNVSGADSLLTLVRRYATGSPAPVAARLLVEAGRVRDAAGDLPGADSLFRAAGAAYTQSELRRSSDRIDYLGWYALTLERQARYAEADSLVRLQLGMVVGPDAGVVETHLAWIHAQTDSLAMARQELVHGVATMGPARDDSAALLYVQIALIRGRAELRLGDVDSAMVHLQGGARAASVRYRSDDPRLAEVQMALGEAYRAGNRLAAADSVLRLAAATFTARWGPDHPLSAETRADLGPELH